MNLSTMNLLIVIIVAVFGASQALPSGTKGLHPDTGLTVEELVEKYGYPIERHENVQTEDGYLLDIHRIPHGRNNSGIENRPVILLMHCLMCSSAVWVAYGPDRGLGFLLADQGYDVWMPSARGTKLSRKHTTLDPDDDAADFWNFSWHQIGYYDLPASIEYIAEQTGQEKIIYIGFSQGTTSFYVLVSEKPEYNDRFTLSISLAPIAYMSNMENTFLQWISQYVEDLTILLDYIGWYEFMPNILLMDQIVAYCEAEGREFCDNLFFIIFGMDSEQMDENMLPVFATHLPAGASAKQFIHYGQEIISGYFRQYDHGLVGNLAAYGQITPPNYDVSKITTPMALIYSEADNNAAVVDVMQLVDELPNVVHLHLVEDSSFGHADFLFSVNVVELVYSKVIDVLRQYSK